MSYTDPPQPQEAGTIRENCYLVINNRPCQVEKVSTSEMDSDTICHFVAKDIFNEKVVEHSVVSSYNCDIPYVRRIDYPLICISNGFASLAEKDKTKYVKLPTDKNLMSQIQAVVDNNKDLLVTVMSAMGEEQICGLKYIGPQ